MAADLKDYICSSAECEEVELFWLDKNKALSIIEVSHIPITLSLKTDLKLRKQKRPSVVPFGQSVSSFISNV